MTTSSGQVVSVVEPADVESNRLWKGLNGALLRVHANEGEALSAPRLL
jgi:hypothetical protein